MAKKKEMEGFKLTCLRCGKERIIKKVEHNSSGVRVEHLHGIWTSVHCKCKNKVPMMLV